MVAGFGAEAAGLAQVIKKRQELAERQAAREAKRASDEAEAETLAEDAAEPDAVGSVERRQQSFEKKAESVRQNYKDHPLEPQVNAQLELQGQAWTRKQVSGEAGRRAKADLVRADEISGRWLERVAQDPAQFDEAVANLLGEDGPVKGLGLRPEVQTAWESQAFEALLSVQMQSDPGRLISDLEAGRWQDRLSEEQKMSWLEDARDAAALRDRKQSSERRQRVAGEVLALQRSIASGEAGLAQIRRAEREGRFSPEQIEGLKHSAEQAEVRAQILQAAQDEYEIALISGIGFDPESEAQLQTAEDFYVATFREAVRAGADETSQDRLADAVARTGYITKGLAQDLTAALSSEDPDRRVAAAQLYGRLLEAAPDLLPPSLEPEVRALGGVLNRWLDAGLPPEEALKRAEAELPNDRAVSFLSDEELGVLHRDLRARLGGQAGHIVGGLLDQLDDKYLGLLGKGQTPREAERQIQKDLGRAFVGLDRIEARLADAGFILMTEDGRAVLVPTEARLQKAALVTGTVAAGFGLLLLTAAALAWGIETYEGLGFDVSDQISDLNDLLYAASDEAKLLLIDALPMVGSRYNQYVVELEDGEKVLASIVGQDEQIKTRYLEAVTPEGVYEITQFYDHAERRYVVEKSHLRDRVSTGPSFSTSHEDPAKSKGKKGDGTLGEGSAADAGGEDAGDADTDTSADHQAGEDGDGQNAAGEGDQTSSTNGGGNDKKTGKRAQDSSKNEPHGDGGRALEKVQQQVEALEELLKTAKNKKEKKVLRKKIQNIIEAAKKKRKGETHGIRGQ